MKKSIFLLAFFRAGLFVLAQYVRRRRLLSFVLP